MCELLGISVSPAAELGLWFKAFTPRAEDNESGWGVGWYEHGEARLVKEAARADESERAAALAADPPASDLFVVHVRAATVGALTEENTHPFRARLHGRDWLFAHNGTVKDLDAFPVGKYRQEGQTDSEVAFHFLLARLERLGRRAGDDAVSRDLLAGARELSAHGRANFLLSDGRTLWAYYDGHKTLHYTTRRAEDLGTMNAEDEDYRIALAVSNAADEGAVIVASVPLSPTEPWVKVKPGEMLVCRDGLLVDHLAAPSASRAAS